MASAPMVGCEGSGGRHRFEVSKVYMRKSFKGSKSKAGLNSLNPVADDKRENETPGEVKADDNGKTEAPLNGSSGIDTNPNNVNNDNVDTVNRETHDEIPESNSIQFTTASPSKASTSLDARISFNLEKFSKEQIWELKQKLSNELDQVRGIFRMIEAKESQMRTHALSASVKPSNSGSQFSGNEIRNNGIKEAMSEVASVGLIAPKQLQRGCGFVRHNSISVMDTNQTTGSLIEKEKRTPKANKCYPNSEFVLGKEKFPPSEGKKSKASKKSSQFKFQPRTARTPSTVPPLYYKQCCSLLRKLMKHKHGWIFNTPVDAVALGLNDYHSIIKRPMDLGTVKSKLEQYQYRSPQEFCEDVRLTFSNAMTYNPKGHDVHIMAEELLQIFEDGWKRIMEEMHPRKNIMSSMAIRPFGALSHSHYVPFQDSRTSLKKIEPNGGVSSKRKLNNSHSFKIPTPKKPKAKDPYKRPMTFNEKQKLSANLQSLPSDRLELIVQILKKRNPSLCQHDEEIEVDIDSFDTETLWELDRFVTNYKKSLSKIRRKALLADQFKNFVNHSATADKFSVVTRDPMNTANKEHQGMNIETEVIASQKRVQPDLTQKESGYASQTSSSSSSSSDSVSSSSDSDTASSSGSESDRCAVQLPSTGLK
eukprot:TRINITY_DN941_c0_g1_i3.p1 TRINITY_DN941_c0_g1~~TRINITY_DN941_c0_g1_i3.p1  ORF type:complete len:649 (-),score=112.46 TRINITY_DN941_c0_g1_i3:169-2115(-)